MRKLSTLFEALLMLLLVGICVGLFIENNNLQKTVKLKTTNAIKQDSLLQLNTKILKEKNLVIKLNKEIISAMQADIKNLKKKDDPNYTGFTFGDKSISLKELLGIVNSTLKQNLALQNDSVHTHQQLRLMKERYGLGFKETEDKKHIVADNTEKSLLANLNDKDKTLTEQNKKINDLENKVNVMKIALELIKKNYNITYVESGNKISIPDSRIDTLLAIYPQIKNKIKVDKKNGGIYIKGVFL